jgi:glutamine amidotransferase
MMDFLKQSHQNKKHTPGIDNQRDHIHHVDGFGFAWLAKDKWKIYKSPKDYLHDDQIMKLADRIPKKLVIGHLRKKIYGKPSIENTHPFIYENQIFLHNGFIKDFPKHQEKIKGQIHPEYLNHIEGESDSEVLFYLFLSIKDDLAKKNSTKKLLNRAIRELFERFERWGIELTANIIYANENHILITRFLCYNKKEYAQEQHPPSLYLHQQIAPGGILITSEPILSNFQLIPENNIIVIDLLD